MSDLSSFFGFQAGKELFRIKFESIERDRRSDPKYGVVKFCSALPFGEDTLVRQEIEKHIAKPQRTSFGGRHARRHHSEADGCAGFQ